MSRLRGLFSGVAVAALATTGAAETSLHTVTYVCERGVQVPVTFINQDEGPGYAVMVFEGKMIPMRIAPTGSGARYVALDEQDGYRLWTKGDEAMIGYLAADHTASEQIFMKECRIGE